MVGAFSLKHKSSLLFSVSVLNDVSYSTMLDYLSTLDVAKRVFLAVEWIKEYSKTSEEGNFERDSVRLETLFGPGRPRKIQSMPGNKPKNTIEELESKLKRIGLTENVQERVWADLDRLKAMGSGAQNQEHHVLTNYLELVASLPWNNATRDIIDIQRVSRRDWWARREDANSRPGRCWRRLTRGWTMSRGGY